MSRGLVFLELRGILAEHLPSLQEQKKLLILKKFGVAQRL